LYEKITFVVTRHTALIFQQLCNAKREKISHQETKHGNKQKRVNKIKNTTNAHSFYAYQINSILCKYTGKQNITVTETLLTKVNWKACRTIWYYWLQ